MAKVQVMVFWVVIPFSDEGG